MEYLGTDYGGWLVDLDFLPQDSTIISAGIGEDISFDLELIKRKNCNIIGIDPTEKSHIYIESQSNLNNFSLIKRALDNVSNDVVTMYRNTNPLHVSESILPTHKAVSNFQSYFAETISFVDLFNKYDNISLIKMDVEGSEYKIFESLISIPQSVKQLCVEFHHFCSDYTVEDTQKIIKKMSGFGFTKHYQNKPNSFAEMTLVREV